MSVQFFVYELCDDEREVPRRLSWEGWRAAGEWLEEEGMDSEARMVRHIELRQVRQVLRETTGLEELDGDFYVAPLPDLRGLAMMFGLATEDTDYIVSTVEMPWLLTQASNGWQAVLTLSVERVGGRETHGYFEDDEV